LETQLKTITMKFNLFEEKDIPKLRINAESFNQEKSDIYSRILVLEERFEKLEGLLTISSENVNLTKSDKKKLYEIQNSVLDLQRWKINTQESLEALRRDQIKEKEVDTKIKTMLTKDMLPKIEQLSHKITTMGRESEENLEIPCEIEDLKNRNSQLEKEVKKLQEKRHEDNKDLKGIKSHLEETSLKIEELKAKEQFSHDHIKLDQNLKKVIEDMDQFKNLTKYTDLIEENKINISRKVDDVKQKMEKIERECIIST